MQDFQTIARLVPNFADRVDDPPVAPEQQARMQDIFRQRLGHSVAYIQPVLFRSGRLMVYAQAAIWGQHIRHRENSLLESFREQGLRVTEITVRVQPDAVRMPPDKPAQKAAYDPELACRQVESLAQSTENQELRHSLEALAARIRRNHSATK